MNMGELFVQLSEIEEAGSNLYITFSKQCSDRLKNTALLLAREEVLHKEMLWEVSSNSKIKQKKISDELNKALEKQLDYMKTEGENVELSSEKSFFKFALELERNSVDIYQNMMEMLLDDEYEYHKIQIILEDEKNI